MIKPITPDEATKEKAEHFPDAVIEIFNRLIAANWDGKTSIVKQRDVLPLIMDALNVSEDYVYSSKLLDVEPIYRENGWKVEYNKPCVGENFDSHFKFSKKEGK